MIQGAHQEAVVAVSEAEISAIAYVEAAEGDVARALLWALEDLIACESRLAHVRGSVSQGFIRAALTDVAGRGR